EAVIRVSAWPLPPPRTGGPSFLERELAHYRSDERVDRKRTCVRRAGAAPVRSSEVSSHEDRTDGATVSRCSCDYTTPTRSAGAEQLANRGPESPKRSRPYQDSSAALGAERSSYRATRQVRVGHQCEDCEGARSHDHADAPTAGGRGDPIANRRGFLGPMVVGWLPRRSSPRGQQVGKVYRIGYAASRGVSSPVRQVSVVGGAARSR